MCPDGDQAGRIPEVHSAAFEVLRRVCGDPRSEDRLRQDAGTCEEFTEPSIVGEVALLDFVFPVI